MPTNDGFRKYLDAGGVLSHVTRARAEELAKELVNAGKIQRSQAHQWVEDLLERSRKATESLRDLVRKEVTRQLNAMGADPEKMARQVAAILQESSATGRRATTSAAGSASSAARKAAGRASATAGAATTAAKKTAAATTSVATKTASRATKRRKSGTASLSTPATKAATPTATPAKHKAPTKTAPTKTAPAKNAAPKTSTPGSRP